MGWAGLESREVSHGWGHLGRLISHAVWGGETPQASRPSGCGNSFLPGPVGLRDSQNAGPRVWRRANAIRPITDLEVQIWKFEEAQPALPNCKET